MPLATQFRQTDDFRPSMWNDRWHSVRDEFLQRLDVNQRPTVLLMLTKLHLGGRGLRLWLRRLAAEECPLPETVPAELVHVYLEYDEAEPLHDCAGCGIAIPVAPARFGVECDAHRTFFNECPCCGGTTGLYAYWSRVSDKAAELNSPVAVTRRKPR